MKSGTSTMTRIYRRGVWVGIVIGMPIGGCLTAIMVVVLKSLLR